MIRYSSLLIFLDNGGFDNDNDGTRHHLQIPRKKVTRRLAGLPQTPERQKMVFRQLIRQSNVEKGFRLSAGKWLDEIRFIDYKIKQDNFIQETLNSYHISVDALIYEIQFFKIQTLFCEYCI